MPTTPKSNSRKGLPDPNRRNRLTVKSSSFHGKVPMDIPEPRIHRPKTVPELLARESLTIAKVRPKLTKLLLNVTVQGSVGPVQVVVSPESTVGDLIAAVLQQYNKEGRRAVISNDPLRFDLHYSQFSLESLNREEQLFELESRNYFLCPRSATTSSSSSSSSSSCSKEVERAAKSSSPWLKFMDFLG